MLNIIRWLAVLPGAILGGVLSTVPLHFVLYQTLTGSGLVEPYPDSPERLLGPFILALIFVWAGSRIAPSRKVETAIFLLGALLLIFGASFALSVTGARVGSSQLYLQFGGAALALGIVGAFTGVYLVHRERASAVEDNTIDT